MSKNTAFLFIFVSFFSWMTSAATLVVEGLRSQDGYVAVSIFSESNQAAYPDKASEAAQAYYVPIQDQGSVEIQLKGLRPGRYAVTVMHDEDGDGTLKKGPMGIPKEGFGFSNNPRVFFGAPDFDKVVMPILEKTLVKISVKYLL